MPTFAIIIIVKEDIKMENKRGSGIFLGVIGVATLIVAIIGASFAYFSAQVSSGEGAVNVSAYDTAGLTVTSVEPVAPLDSEMAALVGIVPLAAEKRNTEGKTMLEYAINKATEKCIDSKGKLVCRLYKATINNTTANPVTFNIEVGTTTNEAGTGEGKEAFKDLKFQSLSGTEVALTLDGSPATIGAAGTSAIAQNAKFTAAANGESVHYFVIYLDEEYTDEAEPKPKDQSLQMGAKFSGKVIYSTGDNGTKLTGTFEGFE